MRARRELWLLLATVLLAAIVVAPLSVKLWLL